jgi:hypothetical protein
MSIVYSQYTDTDSDGMPDYWENRYGLNPNLNDAYQDKDNDGLTNLVEYSLNTNPLLIDTDSDTWPDATEVYYSTNATNKFSYPTKSLVKITLSNPKYGVSKISIFDFNITTSNNSICKFSLDPKLNFSDNNAPKNLFSTTDGYSHSIKDFYLDVADNFFQTYYIRCMTDTGYINDKFPEAVSLSVDRTEPIFLSFSADPLNVIESLDTTLYAQTDDNCVCRFDQAEVNADEFTNFFLNVNISQFKNLNTKKLNKYSDPVLEDNHQYLFYVHCMDQAGWWSTQEVTINLTVNLSYPNKITDKYPQGYLKADKTNIAVVTNKNSNCYFGNNTANQFPQQQSRLHYIEIENLQDREYVYPIKCYFGDGGAVEDTVSFIVDRVPPSVVIINTVNETCSNASLNASFYSSDNNKIAGYRYKIFENGGNVVSSGTTNISSVILQGLNLIVNKTYTWQLESYDEAGNNATKSMSAGTLILPMNHEKCKDNKPPQLISAVERSELSARITLACIDIDGICGEISYFLVDSSTNQSCRTCGSCPYKTYMYPLTITENTTLCYKISDDMEKIVENFTFVKYVPCTNKQDGCCLAKEDKICDTDCSVTQDIDCSPDKIDTDQDGLSDIWERQYGFNINVSDSNTDTDQDGLTNIEEYRKGTDPTNKDTDNDGYDDKSEINAGTDPTDALSYPVDPNKDTDNDGIKDQDERICGLDPENSNDALEDNDGDGLTNKQECITYKTDLNNADTDADKVSDKTEIDKQTDPNDPTSFPKSHLINYVSFAGGMVLLVLGILVFSKEVKMSKSASPKKPAEPLVDFNKQKTQMQQQAQSAPPAAQPPIARQKNRADQEFYSLDAELQKRKEKLKFRKMNTIFDEFASGKQPVAKEDNEKNENREKVFQKLEDMYSQDTYEKIDNLSRRHTLSEQDKSKINRLTRKRR